MASKKYLLFIGILCLFASGSFAQVGTNYNVLDSSFITKKDLPQHNEFMNNAYAFPAKPRNQWEIGVKGGAFTILGDVSPVVPTGGFGVHVRKAVGYVVSLRAEYLHGTAKGISYKPRNGGYSTPFSAYAAGNRVVYDNYKASVNDLQFQAIFSINNIRFHKAKTNFVAYGLIGIGATTYDTKVDALNGTALYNFPAGGASYDDRKDFKNNLEDNILDGDYESPAEKQNEATLGDNALTPSATLGAGMAWRLGKKINLAIEDRVTMAFTDLLDGVRYQNTVGTGGGKILTSSGDLYNFLSVGLNYNIGNSKSVAPLWWINPLDYAYSEINQPKHMKLPKPILDDADGDAITDQFDKEPNTPAGAPVDSHGVSRDTDGDGVPDFKDKELVTPTQCQPVDADGVGKCPDPACCATLDSLIKAGGIKGGCGIGDLPSVSFSGRAVTLSNDAKAVLTSVAEKLRNNPNCKVAAIGYGESSKSAQQLSWDRVNSVINYLVEKEGISSDRFIFKYGEAGGDVNTVDLRDGTSEEGPNTVPAPHPNLRKK